MAIGLQSELPGGAQPAALNDSTATDSTATSAYGMQLHYGLRFEPRETQRPVPLGSGSNAMSWVLTVLILMFVAICIFYHKNNRYFSMLLAQVAEMRERHNAFTDTLRETSFLRLLNLLWSGSAGILLYGLIFYGTSGIMFETVQPGKLAICMGVALGYTLFITVAYSAAGNVFSDSNLASTWVRSYLATQGLEGIVLFPLAILALCAPGISGAMIVAGIIVFFLAKLLFIYKGFCIFFTEITSWVLFLYYLCSLEIVPIVLTYIAALKLCGLA